MKYRITCLNWSGEPDSYNFEKTSDEKSSSDEKALQIYDEVLEHNKRDEHGFTKGLGGGSNFKLIRVD